MIAQPKPSEPLQSIAADEAIPLQEFLRRTGMGRWGFSAACKRGLKSSKIGRHKYILGRDWIAFVEACAGK